MSVKVKNILQEIKICYKILESSRWTCIPCGLWNSQVKETTFRKDLYPVLSIYSWRHGGRAGRAVTGLKLARGPFWVEFACSRGFCPRDSKTYVRLIIFLVIVILLCSVQLHVVHYNSELYPNVSAAITQRDGLAVLGILIEVTKPQTQLLFKTETMR